MSRNLIFSIVMGLTAAVFGCASGSYSGEAAYPADIRTIAVPIFENQSFYRGVEFDLTEAIIKEIETRTPYKVTSGEVADTILTGTVASVEETTLSRTLTGGITQEVQVVLTVNMEWKDLRTGQVLRRRTAIRGSGEYIPTAGVNQPFIAAQHRAVEELSRDIVSLMRSDW